MSESYPHIAGSCPANTALPPLQPRTTIIMHTKRSPVQRAKRASHGEAGCGGDAASRCGNEGQGKRGCRRAGQRIGRKGPREQTYSRRYTQTSSFDGKTSADKTHKTSQGSKEMEMERFTKGCFVCRASLSNVAMRGYQSNTRPQERAMTQDKINTGKSYIELGVY